MTPDGKSLFTERQGLNMRVLAPILLLPVVLIVIPVMAFTGPRAAGPWGIWRDPAPWIVLGVQVAVCLLLWLMRMRTEVRADGLFVQLFPFHIRPKPIPLDGLASQKPVTYAPVREYGGWGIRRGRRGLAYNMRGNEGVLLEYTDGSTLLIGSQEPKHLSRAIARLTGARG